MPDKANPPGAGRHARQRWECRCSDPPILLARYEPGGQIEIKVRDRFYIASGCVHANCPRCGALRVLDLRPSPDSGGSTSAMATHRRNRCW